MFELPMSTIRTVNGTEGLHAIIALYHCSGFMEDFTFAAPAHPLQFSPPSFPPIGGWRPCKTIEKVKKSPS